MQNQQVGPRARRNCVGTTVIVAKLDEQCFIVELLNDRANLPARKLPRGQLLQQCHRVQK